jgi:GSCFA family
LGFMPLDECSDQEASQRLFVNPGGWWSSPHGGALGLELEPPEGSAWHRITRHDFLSPFVEAEFTIRNSDEVFAIGSCFARSVETALAALGWNVKSITDVFDQFSKEGGNGYTNKYNPWAIVNELSWALDPDSEFPIDALQPLSDDTWIDVQGNYFVLTREDRGTTFRRHLLLTELMRRIPECRIIVITLGLIEAFFDTLLDIYTNQTPRSSETPGRFRFRILSFDEVIEALERIHALLSRYGHPDVQVVVTVSPVPLTATFSQQDIVLANTLSKATLRTAAGWWAHAHDNVHYFPSYEIVMNSQRDSAWFSDGVHVRPELVGHIMETFLRTHVADETEPSAKAQSAQIRTTEP